MDISLVVFVLGYKAHIYMVVLSRSRGKCNYIVVINRLQGIQIHK